MRIVENQFHVFQRALLKQICLSGNLFKARWAKIDEDKSCMESFLLSNLSYFASYLGVMNAQNWCSDGDQPHIPPQILPLVFIFSHR